MPIAKHTAAVLGLVPFLVGLGLLGAAPAYATDTNLADHWETAPGEECVKYDDETRPFVLYAAPEGRTFSKVIVKAGAAEDQNSVYTEGLTAGAAFYHESKDSISHVIVCHVATPVVEEPAEEPVTPEPVTPEPVTPEPVTPEPVTPEPVTPEPVTPEPVTPEPVTPEPVTPEPVTPAPADDNGALDDSAFQATPVTEVAVTSDRAATLPETGAEPSPWLLIVAAAMIAAGVVLRRFRVGASA